NFVRTHVHGADTARARIHIDAIAGYVRQRDAAGTRIDEYVALRITHRHGAGPGIDVEPAARRAGFHRRLADVDRQVCLDVVRHDCAGAEHYVNRATRRDEDAQVGVCFSTAAAPLYAHPITAVTVAVERPVVADPDCRPRAVPVTPVDDVTVRIANDECGPAVDGATIDLQFVGITAAAPHLDDHVVACAALDVHCAGEVVERDRGAGDRVALDLLCARDARNREQRCGGDEHRTALCGTGHGSSRVRDAVPYVSSGVRFRAM